MPGKGCGSTLKWGRGDASLDGNQAHRGAVQRFIGRMIQAMALTMDSGKRDPVGDGPGRDTINVLLVDDQLPLLQGLEMLFALESDLRVIGTATTGEAALELAGRLQPDVVVMDVRLPGLDGIAATRLLSCRRPGCKVIALSLYDDLDTRQRALQAGAYAFVTKRDMDGTLLAAIRQAVGN
jgi:CheY-like chemotaxis protein